MTIILLLMCISVAGLGLIAYGVKMFFWCLYSGTGGKRSFSDWWKHWNRMGI